MDLGKSFSFQGSGRTLNIFNDKEWKKIFNSVECFTNSNFNSINITRFAKSGEYNIISTQEEKHGKFELAIEDINSPVAIGFELNVDGILFNINKNHVEVN